MALYAPEARRRASRPSRPASASQRSVASSTISSHLGKPRVGSAFRRVGRHDTGCAVNIKLFGGNVPIVINDRSVNNEGQALVPRPKSSPIKANSALDVALKQIAARPDKSRRASSWATQRKGSKPHISQTIVSSVVVSSVFRGGRRIVRSEHVDEDSDNDLFRN